MASKDHILTLSEEYNKKFAEKVKAFPKMSVEAQLNLIQGVKSSSVLKHVYPNYLKTLIISAFKSTELEVKKEILGLCFELSREGILPEGEEFIASIAENGLMLSCDDNQQFLTLELVATAISNKNLSDDEIILDIFEKSQGENICMGARSSGAKLIPIAMEQGRLSEYHSKESIQNAVNSIMNNPEAVVRVQSVAILRKIMMSPNIYDHDIGALFRKRSDDPSSSIRSAAKDLQDEWNEMKESQITELEGAISTLEAL